MKLNKGNIDILGKGAILILGGWLCILVLFPNKESHIIV